MRDGATTRHRAWKWNGLIADSISKYKANGLSICPRVHDDPQICVPRLRSYWHFGVWVSCFLLFALAVTDYVDHGIAVAVFNLLVDIVVGVFTVWGLFWAASEFTEQASVRNSVYTWAKKRISWSGGLWPVSGNRSRILD